MRDYAKQDFLKYRMSTASKIVYGFFIAAAVCLIASNAVAMSYGV